MKTDWDFAKIWVAGLEEPEDREYPPRDYVWASELGKPYIDVWNTMQGTVPTNPPNGRSLRKFEAGNLWEWVVKIILIRSGLLQTYQERVEYQYDGLLKVTGKMDFVAGGTPDLEKALVGIEGLELPPRTVYAAEKAIKWLLATYPEGLGSKPLELKSVSAFMYDALERTGRALKIHRLQVFHQLKGSNYPEGDIVYLCRDDVRMMRVPVYLNDTYTEQEYRDYIEGLTKYYNEGVQPPLEDCIVFDYDMMKFSKNNQVAWSKYLTLLYGLKDQAEFDEKYGKAPERWNRVLGRVARGDKMTDKNKDVLKEIADAGFNPVDLAAKYKNFAGEETPESD